MATQNILHEPAATQYRRVQLEAALDSIHRDPVPPHLADIHAMLKVMARDDHRFNARHVTPPSEHLMPITQRFFPTGGDDETLGRREDGIEGLPKVRQADAAANQRLNASSGAAVPVPVVRQVLARAGFVALYVAAVVALTLAAMAYGKWAASNGHRALIDNIMREGK